MNQQPYFNHQQHYHKHLQLTHMLSFMLVLTLTMIIAIIAGGIAIIFIIAMTITISTGITISVPSSSKIYTTVTSGIKCTKQPEFFSLLKEYSVGHPNLVSSPARDADHNNNAFNFK